MNIAIALVAAALTGAGLVLQQQSAAQAPKSYFLHLRLITELLRKRRWLAGSASWPPARRCRSGPSATWS